MQSKITFSFLIIILLIISACQQEKPKTNTTIDGIWQSVGYGKLLTIDSIQYAYYDVTDHFCSPIKKGKTATIKNTLELKNDTLYVKRGYSIYRYTRAKELLDICTKEPRISNDPVYNFEVFTETLKTHYAYFELNNSNWDSLYTATKKKITPTTSEVDLYLTMQGIIDYLHDNHGYIEPSDDVYERAEEQTTKQEEVNTLKEYGDFEIAALVADHHLDQNLTKDSWIVTWGTIQDTIGYLQINAMMLFADIQLSDTLIKEEGYVSAYFDAYNKLPYAQQIEKEVTGIRKTMQTVMKDLFDTHFMIVDVRFNGGGNDEVGLEVLRHFNSQKRQIAAKKARLQNSYTKTIPIYLEPHKSPYLNPVYLLTSQQSASATDMMALSSLEIPNITRIGSHTSGAISDALQKKLPNGWEFSLSNEIYMDLKERCYENIGVPVNIKLHYPSDRQTFFRSVADDLEKDKRDILNLIRSPS